MIYKHSVYPMCCEMKISLSEYGDRNLNRLFVIRHKILQRTTEIIINLQHIFTMILYM
uniref:Uncharacterized protein n=1 Tax=Octopus bimaculoides TaxID=37653 RepID=A0A0L8I2P0_OCTBM